VRPPSFSPLPPSLEHEHVVSDSTFSSQALARARAAVKAARDEIHTLEREAEQEAKAAKEKQKLVRPRPLLFLLP